jgi:flagellar motor switch protein FliN/FliY
MADETGTTDVPLNEFQPSAGAPGDQRSIDFLLDVPLALTVELGRTKMIVNDLLQLGQGSVVELTKIVGEPLEVMVNEKLIAGGEVVVLNDKFAVRLTDIISPKDRLDKLT